VIMLTNVTRDLTAFIIFLMLLICQMAYMFHLSGVSVDHEPEYTFNNSLGKVYKDDGDEF
jgi:hypothetical protein